MILENPKILQILKLVTFKEPHHCDYILHCQLVDVYPIAGRSDIFDMLRVCV